MSENIKNPNLIEMNVVENGLHIKLKRHNRIIRQVVFQGSQETSTKKFAKWIKVKDRFKEALEMQKKT